MLKVLRQSTASQSVKLGPFLDDTDGKTPETALTIANTDIKISKAGGAYGNKNSGGGTHDVNGEYTITFDATDTATVGSLKVSCVVAGALPVWDEWRVVEEAVYDALFDAASAGYSTLDAAGIRAALGLASANLDTQLGDVPTLAEMNSAFTEIKGASWNSATDTLEAIRDRGDAAWTTATGFSTLDAAGVRAAVGLASANLDTQLGDVPTLGEMTAAFTEIKGATWATTDTLEAIRDRGDAAWTTATGFSTLDAAGVRAAVGLASANLDSQFSGIPASIWNANLGTYSGTAGSTAEALAAAGGSGDPWVTPLPGAYTAGQAGYIVGTFLDAAISGISGGGLDAAGVRAALGMASANLDTQLADLPTFAEMTAAFTEIKGATWAATDTLEAIRDRGDAAWTTATGFSTLDAAGIRAAVGLASANLDTQLGDVPTLAEMTAAFTEVKGATWDSGTDTLEAIRDRGDSAWITGAGGGLDAAGVRAALGMASANLDAQLDALPTAAEITTSLLTTQMTEAYAADGVAPTMTQALFLIQQVLTDSVIVGTTQTIRKIDGSSTAATLTLNDGSNPTGVTRAT